MLSISKARVFLPALFFAVMGAGLWAGPSREAGPADKTAGEEALELTGRVLTKGSMPHAMTVLSVTEGGGIDYEITGPLREEILSSVQGRLIAVTYVMVSAAAGPGFPAKIEVLSYRIVEEPIPPPPVIRKP